MLNFIICDDNLNILNKLKTMLENIFVKNNFEAKVSYTSDNIDDILSYVDDNKVDVLMLDINLKAGKSGLELAEAVRKKNKDVYLIFTTGHLEYAMVAYKFKTFDYLAKPITYDRLEDTVKRLFEDINGLPKKYIKIDNKNTIIDESQIHYIKRDGMKLIFHTSSRDYDTYSSFAKLEDKLPDNFVRCHKSFVVNLNNVKNVDPVTCIIYLADDSSCYIGPKYKQEFMEVIKNHGIIK